MSGYGLHEFSASHIVRRFRWTDTDPKHRKGGGGRPIKGVGRIPPIVSVVFATLAGAVTEGEVREALAELPAGDRARRLIVFGSDTPG